MQRSDIVFVQEAHCGAHVEDDFMHEFRLTHRCWVSGVPENHRAGGIFIGCKHKFLETFTSITEVFIEQGRIFGIDLVGADGNLKLFNLHMEPCLKTHLRIDLLSRLMEACRHTAMNRCIVAGDFNFVLEAQDRYKPTLKGFTGQREAEGEYSLQQFKGFLEAQQTEYTRRGGRGANTVLSRLDRIYRSIGHW